MPRISYLLDIRESGLFSATMLLSGSDEPRKQNDRPKGICSPEKYRMERTKGNKTPLEEQGQEPSRGERREQRCRPELSTDGGGLHLRRECRGQQALCAKSRAASVWSVSRGGRWGPCRNPAQRFRWGEEEQRSERAFAVGGSEGYGACDDEGQVQGGSACWVSRGQSPLGRVQGGSACSGVQRVKPLAQ